MKIIHTFSFFLHIYNIKTPNNNQNNI